MRYVSLLVMAVAVVALLGCSTPTRAGWCGCLEANCCSWDFYQPCDLIEGRTALECGQPPRAAGMVVSRCYAQPVKKAEDAAEKPVAEFGAPAAKVEEPAAP